MNLKNMQPILTPNNFSIGVDIETIERFEKYASSKPLTEKLGIFTPKEIDYCFKSKMPAKHLAARFCAKEAIHKAFCSLDTEFTPKFNETEIVNNYRGVPEVSFLDERFKSFECKLSLSHCSDKAIAYVFLHRN